MPTLSAVHPMISDSLFQQAVSVVQYPGVQEQDDMPEAAAQAANKSMQTKQRSPVAEAQLGIATNCLNVILTFHDSCWLLHFRRVSKYRQTL